MQASQSTGNLYTLVLVLVIFSFIMGLHSSFCSLVFVFYMVRKILRSRLEKSLNLVKVLEKSLKSH